MSYSIYWTPVLVDAGDTLDCSPQRTAAEVTLTHLRSRVPLCRIQLSPHWGHPDQRAKDSHAPPPTRHSPRWAWLETCWQHLDDFESTQTCHWPFSEHHPFLADHPLPRHRLRRCSWSVGVPQLGPHPRWWSRTHAFLWSILLLWPDLAAVFRPQKRGGIATAGWCHRLCMLAEAAEKTQHLAIWWEIKVLRKFSVKRW